MLLSTWVDQSSASRSLSISAAGESFSWQMWQLYSAGRNKVQAGLGQTVKGVAFL